MGGEESSQIKSKYPGVTSFHEVCACLCVTIWHIALPFKWDSSAAIGECE